MNACLASLVSLLAISACTASSEPDEFRDDCAGGACAKFSIRWAVESGGYDSTCAAVDGATVDLVATFQADNRTAHVAGTCGNGALLTGLLPLGPYRLDLELEGSDGSSLSMQSTTATLAAPNVITEARVTFDATSRPSVGSTFGPCAAGMSCTDPHDTCVTDGIVRGYCSPPCTGDCREIQAYYPPGTQPLAVECVHLTTPDSPQVCVMFCQTDADCVPGLLCDPSVNHCM